MTKDNIKKIDAKGKSLGRVATQVAFYLMGKDNPSFQRHNNDAGNIVYVYNSDFVKITGNKLKQKVYFRHSGYPGGIKSEVLEDMMEKDSREVLKKAIYGMLPKNKLRPEMLKRLKIYNEEIK